MDARAAVPYCVLLVYFRPISLFLTIVSTVVFVSLEKRGLTFPSAMRALRAWFIGQKRPGWISLRRRRWVDYG
jgi:intracellular multiplication protein IcmT